ncbi:MAG TPA: hypothetical protein VH684_07330 [Xanthobacteraceae bacterium]|jgi:hypothetical protein
MAQLSHFGPYLWISFDVGLPPGAQHSWSWGPNPGFLRSGLVATAHPEPEGIDTTTGVERRLIVSMIQSHRTAVDAQFVHVFVRNVGTTPVHKYSLWLTVVNP